MCAIHAQVQKNTSLGLNCNKYITHQKGLETGDLNLVIFGRVRRPYITY